jgi:hypothetical protein
MLRRNKIRITIPRRFQFQVMSWTIERIFTLIKEEVEEDVHLDYKAADALILTDGKKNEISKDVSAFANSDGGVIIYGVLEYTGAKRHKPEKISPVNRKDISKETLEQIINQKITPRVHGLVIYPIPIDREKPDEVIYVVEIPKGNTAHQASDKRYYRRYNFQSIPMDDWEIKDIINRQDRTIAKVRLVPKFNNKVELAFHPKRGKTLPFDIVVQNIGIKAIMLLDSMLATREENVARMFVPQLPYNHRTNIYESLFNNAYEKPVQIGSTTMSFRRPREPILSHTYSVIGELDVYTDFFIDKLAIQITVVTEDNRSTESLRGEELIAETLGDT